jgi:site-specific recombinase XerD
MAELLEDLARSFARHLRAEGKAERTAIIYGQSVTFFGRWLVAHGREPTLDGLSRAAVREWLASLTEHNELSTVRTRYKGLHRFCSWLVAEGEIDANPLAGLDPPTAPAKPVPILSDEQLAALLKACAGKEFRDRRDEAVIRFLLDCGVRVSELCGLTVADVDLDREMAMVTGKGSKVRPVYFGSRTARALDRYKRERARQRHAHLGALFLSQRGALSPDGVRELVNIRGRLAGVEDLNPHRFRHTFAHDFLINGGQERDLKRLAGWSSDAMLERYGASAADVRAREAAKRLKRGDRV